MVTFPVYSHLGFLPELLILGLYTMTGFSRPKRVDSFLLVLTEQK
jgi:hypothetical protein